MITPQETISYVRTKPHNRVLKVLLPLTMKNDVFTLNQTNTV